MPITLKRAQLLAVLSELDRIFMTLPSGDSEQERRDLWHVANTFIREEGYITRDEDLAYEDKAAIEWHIQRLLFDHHHG